MPDQKESFTDNYIFDESLGRHPYTFSLGIKEVLFLSLILFFGFCGFSVCLEKIYSDKSSKIIDDVTIHQMEEKASEPISHIHINDCLTGMSSVN